MDVSKLQYLRIVTIAGSFLVGFWLPLRLLGYIPSLPLEISFDLLISAVSATSLYLSFSRETRSARRLSDWLRFGVALDLVCLLPISLIALAAFDAHYDWLLFVNLLAIRHIRKIKHFLDHFDSLQPVIYRLVPLLTFVPILVHLMACGWIWLGSGTAAGETDKLTEYVKAIYWTMTTLTTVGYGDIAAKTIPQMLYSNFVQLLGVGVFGYIISNVASLLSRSDAAREHHMDNLDRIETFLHTHRVPTPVKSRIRAYYHYLWVNKKGYSDRSLLDGLPGKIQSEIFFHINRSIIEKVSFLKDASQELLEDLMNELEPRIFVPGERIFRIDEAGDALYFIHSGEVNILTRDGKTLVTLSEGAFFGEMALVSDKPRNATARAASFCDVYLLSRSAFERVTSAYPEFRTHIEQVVRERTAS